MSPCPGAIVVPVGMQAGRLAGSPCGFGRLAGDTLQLAAVDLRGRGRSEVTGAGTYGWPITRAACSASRTPSGRQRWTTGVAIGPLPGYFGRGW